METRILTILTRTPLHVGAGASVGAIDQPIIRERHTGLPIIPGSSLKGALAELWMERNEQRLALPRVTGNQDGKASATTAAWLFGSDDAKGGLAAAGALLFSEARLLAFPIRSARGSFAWITSPLLLRRAVRDGVLKHVELPTEPADNQAFFTKGGRVAITQENPVSVVLEEYTFSHAQELPEHLGKAIQALAGEDPVWTDLTNRLVIVSDGQMSFFCQAACDVAQHVRIDDDTGTADDGGLFNQENVPADALFYAIVHATESRLKGDKYQDSGFAGKTAQEAIQQLETNVHKKVVQFGADASTGLGFCSVALHPAANDSH